MMSLKLKSQSQNICQIGVSRADKQNFITKSTEVLNNITKELAALQITESVDEATVKRINRLKQIEANLQQSIEKAKVEICFGRPYGM